MDYQKSWVRVRVLVDWKLALALAILGIVVWLLIREPVPPVFHPHRWQNFDFHYSPAVNTLRHPISSACYTRLSSLMCLISLEGV